MAQTTNNPIYSVTTENNNNQSHRKQPPRPNMLPYPATTENVPLLEKYILEQFKNSAFNKSTPFPSMSAKPAHIPLKSGSHPYVQHVTTSIPFHWKEEVKQSLDKDVANNIIEPIPIGKPVERCSKMEAVKKRWKTT